MSQTVLAWSVPLSHQRNEIENPLEKLGLGRRLYTEIQKPVTPAFEIVFIFT